MRANNLIKENIDALLRARHQSRKDLAQWCHRTESWISKIFKQPNRDIPGHYLDRIADFFGVAVYQLYQPGISRMADRRVSQRRTGVERRIGQTVRAMLEVGAELDRVRSPQGAAHAQEDRRTPALPDPLRTLLVQFERRIAAHLATADPGGQTARTRKPKPAARPRRRIDRGSDAPSSD